MKVIPTIEPDKVLAKKTSDGFKEEADKPCYPYYRKRYYREP